MFIIDIQTEQHSGDYSVFIHLTSAQINAKERVAEADTQKTREIKMLLRNDAFNFVVLDGGD